jgi:hypothetical protein
LAFLNAAQTASEIADRVEFPGEPDVGIRVAQRILDRRDQLGSFANLRQVADVRQVGPERFTEIVVALVGRPRPATPGIVEVLERENQALRRSVADLTASSGRGGEPTRPFNGGRSAGGVRTATGTSITAGTRVTDMFDPTEGPARDRLDGDEVRKLRPTGALIIGERRRPLYFDGRFLAARDLTREQNYFLSRQADLARAGGGGVAHGLVVTRGDSATSVTITLGHGVTPAGELVVVPRSVTVNLANVPEIERLDRAFGLSRVPRPPARNRSGLFVVALRPVEFTANPIASYPTSVEGTRSVEDGDIIEAAAITLVPYRDGRSRDELDMRRAHAAHEIFVDGQQGWSVPEALPVAVVAMDRGVVEWVDPFLVRREVGAEHKDVLGLGFAPRILREAHLLQYDHHLRDVLEGRDALNQGWKFPASAHFAALPPAGRMPSAAIDPTDFTHVYFPQEVDVELSIVPTDEIAALLEESLVLPPVDLTAEGQELESTSVMVLVPVERQRLSTLAATLTSFTRALKPAAPGLVARRRPLEALNGLSRIRIPTPAVRPEAIADGAWRTVLAENDMLWYVRRRNHHTKTEIVGVSLAITGDELAAEEAVNERVRDLRLTTAFRQLESRSSAEAFGATVTTLSAPAILDGPPVLMRGAINELEAVETVDRAAVRPVTERFSEPGLGEGITRLERVAPTLREAAAVKAIAESGAVPELDRLARTASEAELPVLAQKLEEAAATKQPETVAAVVREELAAAERTARLEVGTSPDLPGLTQPVPITAPVTSGSTREVRSPINTVGGIVTPTSTRGG